MIIKPLYKYTRPDGGETVSTTHPECEYITLYRLIADEGMVLQKNGGEWVSIIDVTDIDGWVEGVPVEDPDEPEPEQKILTFLLPPPVNPEKLTLNEVEYAEWQNLKKKVSAFERDLSIVAGSFSNATEVLK